MAKRDPKGKRGFVKGFYQAKESRHSVFFARPRFGPHGAEREYLEDASTSQKWLRVAPN
jgi:hypothetical protein